MFLNINTAELEWLQRTQPKLTYVLGSPSIIRGILQFDMLYDKNYYVINPNKSFCHDNRITDNYEVEIKFENISPSSLPQVRETAGRIKKVKEKYNKQSLADVHINPNGTICLCAYPEERNKMPNGFNLKDFFELFLIPVFYAQSYYEKHGKWIWGERSHGSLGLLESYLDERENGNDINTTKEYVKDLKHLGDSHPYIQTLLNRERVKGHLPCFCGSRQKFRKCHQTAFQGLWHLKEDMKIHKVSVKNM